MSKGSKALMIIGIIVGVIALFFLIVNIIPVKKTCDENPWRRNGDFPYISAHRGGSQLNPENTVMAFDYAINETHYIDIVEFDAWYTKDGVMVISHDGKLNRMACAEGDEDVNIHEHTLAELREYNLGRNFVDRNGNKPYENLTIDEARDKGLTIITVDEFFSRYNGARDDVRIAFEVKEEAVEVGSRMVDEIYTLIKQKYPFWDKKVLIISFGNDVIDYCIKTYPDEFCGPLGYKIAMQVASNKFGLNGLVQVDYKNIQTQMYNKAGKLKFDCGTKSFNRWAHKRNQSTTYWTIDDEADMQKLIKNGADMLTTNAPDVLYRVIHGKDYTED